MGLPAPKGPIQPIPGGNVRAALLRAEFHPAAEGIGAGAEPPESWDSLLVKAVDRCVSDKSAAPLALREVFYNLLTHAIPTDCIFKATTTAFLKKTSEVSLQRRILELAGLYVS